MQPDGSAQTNTLLSEHETVYQHHSKALESQFSAHYQCSEQGLAPSSSAQLSPTSNGSSSYISLLRSAPRSRISTSSNTRLFYQTLCSIPRGTQCFFDMSELHPRLAIDGSKITLLYPMLEKFRSITLFHCLSLATQGRRTRPFTATTWLRHRTSVCFSHSQHDFV